MCCISAVAADSAYAMLKIEVTRKVKIIRDAGYRQPFGVSCSQAFTANASGLYMPRGVGEVELGK